MQLQIKIKLLNDRAKIPTRGSEYSAGYDLYAAVAQSVKIPPHESKKIETGIVVELPQNVFGAIFPRSGLASKQGLRLSNSVGVCDPDYRGEYLVSIFNDSDTIRTIQPGDRVAQLVFLPFQSVEFEVVDELSDTVRGDGGFGSTGQ